MIAERGIDEAWIGRTIDDPQKKSLEADGNVHYIKSIEEHSGRILRVIINEAVEPNRIVTVFFDRRLR
jgi:hypothetical protein